MKGIILDVASLAPDDLNLQPITRQLEEWQSYGQTTAQQLNERLVGAEIVLTNKVAMTEAVLVENPQIKYIGVLATGTNNVDLATAKARQIVVSNVRGYGTHSVAQHTLGLILNLATRQPDYLAAVKQGQWQQSEHFCLLNQPILELAGKTCLIVGLGELGQAVAKLVKALGMKVIAATFEGHQSQSVQGVERLPFEAALPQADVISLHCPLSEQTEHLFNRHTLRLVKPGALLINTARGGLIEEQALVDALHAGWLGGAALDVVSEEPPPVDHPLFQSSIPNLYITPHNAWGTQAARQTLVNMAGENLAAFLSGKPINQVC
ncbi:D-2-hydroxyacid dehydrogenase [Spartinivicinus poritis]|uniref:D-2-hydroxyacid dehydrogenase n=1 Tax=Spartinivicinus poritis TaxID=2994640 RepID=A0ABT5U742_9GAMM|nr:D-2-hydroxyacid dehydrogenase [Spartinivicinus sp. A2-2]MDE1461263.1 D-2-hydroxyacid dehydrogenase [Spartinivicinus sp. A2-2]